jgi:hypothetical protein
MTADAVNLLAEIRRLGGDVKLVSCDKLKLVAPSALMPELTKRVRVAKPMLLAVLSNDITPARREGEGVLYPSNDRATAQHSPAGSLREQAISVPAAEWHARHREALAYWSALHPPGQAAALAWGEIEDRWHRLHGARWPPWQCAGCDQPIGGLAAMTLADGSRVHLGKLSCLLCFGRRWRSAASSALRRLGIEPPPL